MHCNMDKIQDGVTIGETLSLECLCCSFQRPRMADQLAVRKERFKEILQLFFVLVVSYFREIQTMVFPMKLHYIAHLNNKSYEIIHNSCFSTGVDNYKLKTIIINPINYCTLAQL